MQEYIIQFIYSKCYVKFEYYSNCQTYRKLSNHDNFCILSSKEVLYIHLKTLYIVCCNATSAKWLKSLISSTATST